MYYKSSNLERGLILVLNEKEQLTREKQVTSTEN